MKSSGPEPRGRLPERAVSSLELWNIVLAESKRLYVLTLRKLSNSSPVQFILCLPPSHRSRSDTVLFSGTFSLHPFPSVDLAEQCRGGLTPCGRNLCLGVTQGPQLQLPALPLEELPADKRTRHLRDPNAFPAHRGPECFPSADCS